MSKKSVKSTKKSEKVSNNVTPIPASITPKVQSNPIQITAKAINRIGMLVRLKVSSFGGNFIDAKLTKETRETHGIQKTDKVKTTKIIMQGDELNAVKNVSQKLRLTHERLTRPWYSGGWGAFRSQEFNKVKDKFNALIEEFNSVVSALIRNYDTIIERDKKDFNGAFDISLYPSKNELASKFNVFVEYGPITTKDDWRVEGLSDEVMARVQADMEKGLLERMKEGDAELLRRLHEKLDHLVTRLSTKNPSGEFRFKQNSLDNVKETAEEIASLNIGENPFIAQISEKLAGLFDCDADLLRENEDKRKEKAKEGKERLKEIEEAMRGLV